MGRLSALVASGIALGLVLLAPAPTTAFDGFGSSTATSTYGEEVRFDLEFDGPAPDRLELLIRTPGSEASLVVPVTPSAGEAEYVWDTSVDHVTPNTLITYTWRATDGDDVTTSTPATIRYVDDRPGLDWRSARLGEATVHWYGGAEQQARRFGEVSADAVAQAEELLGTELAGPVDVFVYVSEDDFFGALGPGAREWTGAATYPELRTIFMWLGGGSGAYLENTMVHEVTHVVFGDATANSFHEPATWLNEGIATWSESHSDDGERQTVESEASDHGLFAFDALSERFPVDSRGALLAYAQGTTMVQRIIDRYGTDAIAAIMAAYRDGASDAEALEAGTGVAAPDLYAGFFAAFDVDPPMPVTPDPILPSDVDRPGAGTPGDGGDGSRSSVAPQPAPGEPNGQDVSDGLILAALLVMIGIAAFGAAVVRRRTSGDEP